MQDSDLEVDTRAQFQLLLDQLRGTQVVNPDSLLGLLSGPLDAIGLLPPQFRRYLNVKNGTKSFAISIKSHIPQIQRILLTHIYPTWAAVLSSSTENGTINGIELLDQYFCPNTFVNARPQAGEVALFAYATLLSTPPLSSRGVHLLSRLAAEYPIDRLYTASFSSYNNVHGSGKGVIRDVVWEDCVRNACMVPDKVANALAENKELEIPESLENATYFNRLSVRCEQLIYTLSKVTTGASQDTQMSALVYLLGKLVNVGVFPPSPPVARSQPSFFQSTLPAIRQRLQLATSSDTDAESYSAFWSHLFLAIPSALTLQSILASLLSTLPSFEPPTDDSLPTRSRVRWHAALLFALVGKVTPEKQELWEISTSLSTMRDWAESDARFFVCWMSGGARKTGRVDFKVLDAFLEVVLDIWSSSEHIKHSLISRHRYTTSLLLLTISYFPPSSPYVQSLVSKSNFIKAISIYISHLDPSVRRCGMLAAEVIAHLCGKQLAFDDWDGDDHGKSWCRALRELLKARDVDAKLEQDVEETTKSEETELIEEMATPAASELLAHKTQEDAAAAGKVTFVTNEAGYDSDDSVTGYASHSSSRSASPTPEELAQIEKDPTLNVGIRKVTRPVYLAQLGDLLRGTGTKMPGGNEPHEADRIEMALACGEELIRRKKGYETEIDENAVNLAYGLLSLQDNFELEGFSDKRQGALNALVACAPQKATPALIQEFFKNQYSADQRFVALNAIAIGARELASLPIPPSNVSAERTAFPSKRLPAPLHAKYIAAGKANTDLVPLIMDDISKRTLDKQRESTTDSVPEIARERRLRLQKSLPTVTEVVYSLPLNPFSGMVAAVERPSTRFIDVAAEFFIMPLINRFWAFLRDEQAREERTFNLEGRARYHGAGTGLILNALVLAQFIRTLAILVNAAQNASEWLAIIAPDALELAVTLGTRPMSYMEDADEDDGHGDALGRDGTRQSKEASVLTSSLELALVILDGALEIDGGRTLGLEHTTLVLGLGEWVGKVFSSLEKGVKAQGGGGAQEQRLSQAAAGVLLKIDELTSKWKRSMLDTR